MPNEECVMRCGRQTDGHTLLFRTFRLARSAVRHCKVVPIKSLTPFSHASFPFAHETTARSQSNTLRSNEGSFG
jgi:hypothetical protein